MNSENCGSADSLFKLFFHSHCKIQKDKKPLWYYDYENYKQL